MMPVQDIPSLEKANTSDSTIAQNSKRKNHFLAACKCINSNIDLSDVNVKSPFGGMSGVDDSRLEHIFSFSKIMRMHAVLHDASAFMKRYSIEGPGYIYIQGTHSPELLNTCFLGQITGIFYCCFLKVVDRKIFKIIRCMILSRPKKRFKSFPNEQR